jgi:hypothetical protein
MVFESGGGSETGTVGAMDFPNIPADSRGHFHTTIIIPAALHSLQGRGGGPTRPGTYDFVSQPVACFAPFTVSAT